MKKVFEDSTTEIYETENGSVIGIYKDNSLKQYYTVTVKQIGSKVKTVATRCTYKKAMQIASEVQ